LAQEEARSGPRTRGLRDDASGDAPEEVDFSHCKESI
jgi:hypothetical protein